ncbi:hypothetical protein PAPHI01_1247 [Pancytospora philotis]|nr:hypothetical protein PAPHI01_1247 [Pancytospora philotis]
MGEMSVELSKVLAKVMQNSFKRKEVTETVERIMGKMERVFASQTNEQTVRELRSEFEKIRKSFYGLNEKSVHY